jgi:hypothetical protein
MSLIPEYARPGLRPPPSQTLRYIALVCSLGPMLFGIGCLAMYWLTRAKAFISLGVLTLLGGAICFFVGLVCAIVYYTISRSHPHVDRKQLSHTTAVALGLLLLNIPVAFGCMFIGGHLATQACISIRIENDGAKTVSGIVLNTPDGPINIKSLQPGEVTDKTLFINGSGGISISTNLTPPRATQNVLDYVDSDTGQLHATVVITDDSIKVH